MILIFYIDFFKSTRILFFKYLYFYIKRKDTRFWCKILPRIKEKKDTVIVILMLV